MVSFTTRQFKSILNKKKSIDPWFWDRFTINPYQGCQYGCIYCNARSEQYHLPIDFENDIIIKENAEQLLHKRLSNARTLLPDVVALSGVTDPYQPIESRYHQTRKLLKVLASHSYPVHIITKSPLVLHDLDILEEIASKSWCTVSVSLSSVDDEMLKILDKKSPPAKARLELVKNIKHKSTKVQAGFLMMPVIHEMTDSISSLHQYFSSVAECNADYVVFAGLSMTGGQIEWFMKSLAEKNSMLKERVMKNYRGQQKVFQAPSQKVAQLNRTLRRLCEEYSMPYRISRWHPPGYRNLNYRLAEWLFNQGYEKQIMGLSYKEEMQAGFYIQELKESVSSVISEKRFDKKAMTANLLQNIEAYIRGQPN